MEGPALIDIHADRHVACYRRLSFVGFDFTGADFVAQVRKTPEATGSALIDLATTGSTATQGIRLAYSGTADVVDHISNGYLTVVPDGLDLDTPVALSVVVIQILETGMEGLPLASVRSKDLTLYWDMHITPSGGIKDKYAGGEFLVRAGVTAT